MIRCQVTPHHRARGQTAYVVSKLDRSALTRHPQQVSGKRTGVWASWEEGVARKGGANGRYINDLAMADRTKPNLWSRCQS